MATIILGDIVEVIKETVHNPQESGFQYFVGLEHYDSGEPLITRYATPDNLTSSVKHFAKGDILVARRNVYLKRASLVDFEGVTSGDSIVLRAKDKKYQQILPFILNSDDFWDYAEQNSDGTMSKRLSPADLLDYEFEEPENIELLADKLWAAYRVKESYKKLLAAADDMLKAKFQELFGEEEKIKIGDAFTTTSGGTPNSKITHYYSGGTIPWLTSGEVRQGYIQSTESYITEEGLANSSAKWIPESSVVIAMYGATIGNVGITNIPLTTNQAICSILPNNKYDQVFVYYAVKNKTDWMKSQSRGAAQPNISQAIIKQMEIPLPPLPLQQQFVEIATQAEATKESLRKSIENIDQVIKSLINQ
jgi:type I restriction enzyme S subunit